MNAVAPPAAAAVSGWRWPAIVIGLGVLLLLYIAAAISRRGWIGRKLLEGADGQPSISKFQWLLWAAVTLFAYTALWVLRGVAGHYPAVGRIPVGLVVIFALSVGTGVAAAGIASARDREGRDALAVALISRGRTPGGIFRDDTGVLDLSKVQLLAFTVAAAGVFLADFVRQVVSSPLAAGLPDIDPSLVFLVGISQCSYLVRKFVVSRSPAWRADQPSRMTRTACAWLILVGTSLAVVRTFGSGVFAATAQWLFWFEAFALAVFDFSWLADGAAMARRDGRNPAATVLTAARTRAPNLVQFAVAMAGAGLSVAGFLVTVIQGGQVAFLGTTVSLGVLTVVLAVQGELGLHGEGSAGPRLTYLRTGKGHADVWPEAVKKEEPRWILAQAYDIAHPEQPVERAFRADAPHLARVQIGPERPDMLRAEGGPPIDEVLPRRPGDHDLVIVFIPAGGQPQSQAVVLPEAGPSRECAFIFQTGPPGTDIEVQIVVLHRNRVLQAAALRGRALADPAAATADDAIRFTLSVVRPGLSDLDGRERFDAAVVVAHTPAGTPAVVGISEKEVALFDAGRIEQAGQSITSILTDLADCPDKYSPPLDNPANVDLLRALAFQGRLLYEKIGQRVSRELAGQDLNAIQVVVCDSSDFIPVELIYDLPAPASGAGLCPNWRQALADGHCDKAHHPDDAEEPDLAAVVCPLGFWALSKVIERQVMDNDQPLTTLQGKVFGIRSSPTAGRLHLPGLAPALFAASQNVDRVKTGLIDQVMATLTKLTANRAVLAGSWAEWVRQVKALNPSLLVLLSHTERAQGTLALEIGEQDQRNLAQIRRSLVKASPDVAPVVLLLGCDTAVADREYQSFAGRFLDEGAALVVATIASVLGEHAAPVAEALATALHGAAAAARAGEPSGPATFGVTMRDIRRELLSEGELMSLCLATFGDADWRLKEG